MGLMKKISTLFIWRADVPPQVFNATVGNEYLKKMDPINKNIFRVKAKNRSQALSIVWDIVKDCGVPVSKDDIKIGEYPSKMEAFVE